MVRTIARGWRVIVAFTAFGIAAAVVVILFAPRKFTGTTTVVLKAGSTGPTGGSSVLSQISGLGDITAGLLGGKSPMETEIEVMQSRSIVEDVVDSLRLSAEVMGPRPLPSTSTITRLDTPLPFKKLKLQFQRDSTAAIWRYQSDSGLGRMSPGSPMRISGATIVFASDLPQQFTLILRDRQDAIDWVSNHLKVEKGKGEVASITYRGDDSVTAAHVPNVLLDVYFGRRRGVDRGINQRRVEFLTAKSDSMERMLVVAAQTLRRQQEASGMLDPKEFAKVELQTGATLRNKLTDVLVEQGALKQLISQINDKTLRPRDLAAYPRFINSPVINNLVSQLSDIDFRRTQLLTQHAVTDPDVVTLDKSAVETEAKIVPYAKTYGDALEKERIDLSASIDNVNTTLARIPKALESSGQLESDVLGLTRLFGGIQGQIVEAKLAAIGEGGDVRPLDRAEVPKKPSFPSPVLTASVGTVGGLIVGLFAALLVGSVGRWMRDPVEVERATGVPALRFDPTVPLMLAQGTATIIVAPIRAGLSTTAVVHRLQQTAASRAITSVVLDLVESQPDANAAIGRLAISHDLVIVKVPSLTSDSAAATLQHGRPVLLVVPGRRTERRGLLDAVQMLRRLEVPVAGIVMSEPALNDGDHKD